MYRRRAPVEGHATAVAVGALHNQVVLLKRRLNASIAREKEAHLRAARYREQRDAAERRAREEISRMRLEMQRRSRTPITSGLYGGPEGLQKAVEELYGKRT